MKLNKNLSIVFLFIAFSVLVYGQEQNATRIGISTIIQGSQIDLLVPIKTESFSIAPSFGLLWAQDGGTDIHLGIIPRFYLTHGKAKPYLGGRVGILIYSPNQGSTTTDYLIGLSGGGEYFLNEHFSFGVEAQLNLTISDSNSLRFGNPGKDNLNTASAVFVSYYF